MYYLKPGMSEIVEVVHGILPANGIGLSPDGTRVYVAETYAKTIWWWKVTGPGQVEEATGVFPHGGTMLYSPAGLQGFDSLAVDAEGHVCQATLVNGGISVVDLESGELVAFAVDSAGRVWRCSLNSSPAPFMDWRLVGGSGLAGPVTTALTTTGLRLFARDANGAVQTATYTAGALSDWTSLGGSGLTDQVAVVLYPGYRLRIFVRAADGTLQSKIQNTAGVFEPTWQPVGTLATTGSPAAILDPATGRTAVVARGTDNEVYRVFESGQLTGVWGDWARVSPDVSDPAVTDVTVAPYTGAGGESWLLAFRNVNDTTRIYERQLPAATAAKSARTAGTPSFSAHSLPAPPDPTRKDTPR